MTCVNHQLVVKPYRKTGENREIILDQDTLAILRSWRSYQQHERVASGASHACASPQPDCGMLGYHVRDLVFAQPDGNYLHRRVEAARLLISLGADLDFVDLERRNTADMAIKGGSPEAIALAEELGLTPTSAE